MSKEQISRRHHYLPEFLLKGFAGDDGKLFVYDKKAGRFWKDAAYPKQVFWRHNQNTFTIGDEETDFVEQIYSKIDNDFSPVYACIVQMPGPVNLYIEDIVRVLYFTAISYYRVPINDETVKTYVKNNPPQKLGFRLYNKVTNKDVDREVYDIVMNEPSFVESYRISKALMELQQYSKVLKTDEWVIAAPVTLNGFGLIGDNPVILKDTYVDNFVKLEMIMPLSKHHITYHLKGDKSRTLPPEHKFTIDLFQFIQAGQYVCGCNREYLQHIADYAKKPDLDKLLPVLKAELFSL